jgi:2-iminobutanoate/2-iminopropanoate deaminase
VRFTVTLLGYWNNEMNANDIKTKFPDLEVTHCNGNAVYVNGIKDAVPPPPFLSQLTVAGDTVYVSGQIALDPKTNKMIEKLGVETETNQIFDNIEVSLAGVGLTLGDVVKSSVYLTNFDELPKFNEIYIRRMNGCRPAREAVQVVRLALGATVEITVTAYKPNNIEG